MDLSRLLVMTLIVAGTTRAGFGHFVDPEGNGELWRVSARSSVEFDASKLPTYPETGECNRHMLSTTTECMCYLVQQRYIGNAKLEAECYEAYGASEDLRPSCANFEEEGQVKMGRALAHGQEVSEECVVRYMREDNVSDASRTVELGNKAERPLPLVGIILVARILFLTTDTAHAPGLLPSTFPQRVVSVGDGAGRASRLRRVVTYNENNWS